MLLFSAVAGGCDALQGVDNGLLFMRRCDVLEAAGSIRGSLHLDSISLTVLESIGIYHPDASFLCSHPRFDVALLVTVSRFRRRVPTESAYPPFPPLIPSAKPDIGQLLVSTVT